MFKLLVVDCERETCDQLERLFEGKYKVFKAVTGEDAVRILEEEVPDVMILDLKIPDVPGTEILRRRNELGLKTKVIAITDFFDEPNLKEEVDSLGIEAYFLKPYRLLELRRAVDSAVGN